jgi:hypothetical protein
MPRDARSQQAARGEELYVVLLQSWADKTDQVVTKLTLASIPWRSEEELLVPPPGLGAVALSRILVPERLIRAAVAIIAAEPEPSAVSRQEHRLK